MVVGVLQIAIVIFLSMGCFVVGSSSVGSVV